MQQVFCERRKEQSPTLFPDRRKQEPGQQTVNGFTGDGSEADLPGFADEKASKSSNHSTAVSSGQQGFNSKVRQYEREKFKIPVCFKIEKKEIVGYTHDVSLGGLLLYTSTILKPGTPVTLQFSFGENLCYLNISGQVVFCRKVENGDSPLHAIGIKFSAVRDFEQTILTSAVQELKRNTAIQEKSLLNINVFKDSMAIEAADFNILIPRTLEEDPDTTQWSCIHASKIVGWGSYLPSKEITNQDISAKVRANGCKNVGEVVEALTGIKSRRYADPKLYPSDLAAMAAKDALNNAGMDPRDLDVIIFCGIATDFDEPATANVVQEKIGAKNAYVFDLRNACNGFVTAIDALDAMIAAGRGENGIVVTGELISPYIDWEPKTKKDFKLSVFGYTIGDSGGAAVLTRVKTGEERGIRARWFSSEGSYWRLALAGKLEGANADNKFFRSQGSELEKTSIEYMPRGFEEILKMLNWDMSEIDAVIPHQIPASIYENVYHKALGIPYDKLVWTFPEYGNLATASMPVAICEAINTERIKSGDKILLAGGAAGFTTGFIGLIF